MKVVLAPDNKLRVVTKPVKKITPGLLQTIKEMVKLTKTFVDPEGVGLAATQVGLSEQYFVAKDDNGTFRAYFNPKITKYSKRTKKYFEGCLSIPNFWGEVVRSTQVTVSYLDDKGNHHTEVLKGTDAWIFQHETDHLAGKLFMDVVLEQQGRLFKVVGKDPAGSDIFEEVSL